MLFRRTSPQSPEARARAMAIEDAAEVAALDAAFSAQLPGVADQRWWDGPGDPISLGGTGAPPFYYVLLRAGDRSLGLLVPLGGSAYMYAVDGEECHDLGEPHGRDLERHVASVLAAATRAWHELARSGAAVTERDGMPIPAFALGEDLDAELAGRQLVTWPTSPPGAGSFLQHRVLPAPR